MSEMGPQKIRVLAPRVAPPALTPWWVLLLFLVQFFAETANHIAGNSLEFFTRLLVVPCVVASAYLGGWFEEHAYFALRLKPPWMRVLGSLLASFFALIAGLTLGVLALMGTGILGISSALPLNLLVVGAWMSVSAWGTILVLSVGALLSVFQPVLAVRIKVTVIGILIAAFGVSIVLTLATTSLQTLVTWADGSAVQPSWLNLDFSDEELHFFIDNPAQVALVIRGIGALLVLPAALSAATKLAYSVVERLEPLTEAFGSIAQGDSAVSVAPGGARDLRFLIDRFNDMATRLTLAKRMERAFGQYVSDQVMERIRAQHGEATLAAESKIATVFFADIRGFTSMSEKLTPEQVVSLLNRYYTRVVKIINEHQGYLDKFIGDAVVVVFNGPIEQQDHAQRAVRCAIAMQEAIEEMNESGAFPEIGRLDVGAGICTGPMVCGNVGSEEQMEYTVIGDTVNLAARFCGHAAAREVWVNEACRGELAEHPCEALPAMTVKGKADPVTPHRVWPPKSEK